MAGLTWDFWFEVVGPGSTILGGFLGIRKGSGKNSTVPQGFQPERTLGEFSRFIGGILGILSRVLTFFRKKGARMGWAGWMRKEEG